MNRLFVLAGVLALVAVLGVARTYAPADDKKDEKLSIKQIMTKAHKGGDAYLAKARKAAKDENFTALKDSSKMLVKLGGSLEKAKPEQGGAESWKTLTTAYVKAVKALDKAADDKNADDATKALKMMTGLCKKCHDTHK